MALWGKTDTAADAPNYADANTVFFVDTTESAVESNKAKGLGTPGWNSYRTYVDSDGNTRHRAETLVAMKVAAADAGDVGVKAIVNATDLVTGTEYVIETAGTTDFTTVGAADSVPGTVFTATGVATGTGTVRVSEDATVADA